MKSKTTEEMRELVGRYQNGTATGYEIFVLELWYDFLLEEAPVQLSEEEKEEDLKKIKANLDKAFNPSSGPDR